MRLLRYTFRAPDEPEHWITPLEAATILDRRNRKGEVSARWVYTHLKSIPGAHRPSAHVIKIPESGVRRLLAVR